MAYMPSLCFAIALSWPAFAAGYMSEAAVSRMELAVIVLGSSIFLGSVAMLFVSLPVLASVALAACSMALALLAAATSFGSYLVGAVH